MEIRYIPLIVATVGPINTIFCNLVAISKGGKGRNGASVANTSIVFPVFPLGLFLFFTSYIANSSESDLYLSNICLYILTFGLIWSKITIKLIVRENFIHFIYFISFFAIFQ